MKSLAFFVTFAKIYNTKKLMRLLTKIKLLALGCVFAVAAASCDSDPKNNDTITQQYMRSCYAVVTDLQSGQVSYSKSMTFFMILNWSTGKASFSFSGLSLNGTAQSVLGFEDIDWTLDPKTGICAISKSGINGGNPNMGITTSLTDLDLRWFDRLDFGQKIEKPDMYDPMFTFSFTIDSRYQVVGSRQPFYMTGTTTSTAAADGAQSSTKQSIYTTTLDFDKKTATIEIAQAKFVDGMPSMTMEFRDIPFTLDEYANVTLEVSKEFIPYIANTPQESFPISDLKAFIKIGRGMTLDFNCNVRNKAMYSVHADLDYTSYTEL